ncbi:MAG: L,D-transpeptidase family protein, partial [Gammaproteobacteria bacterium]|nr:L,D-transpeptidase family protein [Gammaproteobacteria bacterium]
SWLLVGLLWASAANANTADDLIRSRVEAVTQGFQVEIAGKVITAADKLQRLYAASGYQPIWVQSGRLNTYGRMLLDVLSAAQDHGLDTAEYHLPSISARLASRDLKTLDGIADLDVLMSDGALTYASHLVAGKVEPEKLYKGWKSAPRERDVVSVLWTARNGDPIAVKSAYALLAPGDLRYHRLRALLARYRDESRKFIPKVPDTKLAAGDHDPGVASLRDRLAAWGDHAIQSDDEPNQFDETLEADVKKFQLRHGLDADGVVGAKTRAALNTSLAYRARQIKVNLERWRWLPLDLGARRIEVNIAGFHVDVIEDNVSVLPMKAIVGKRYHKTPVFSGLMTYLVLNPSWNVPPSIAANEFLPKLRQDPSFLVEDGYRLLSGWGENRIVLDAHSIDWHAVAKRGFPYRIQQLPGDKNALGKVKFMFPNEFDVYLHDTPARSLFARTTRDFSHGCVRLEKPLDLAPYLLRGDPVWPAGRIERVLETKQETTVLLKSPIPVHILYWTAWVDEQGTPHFRNDIYDRDTPLAVALTESISPKR